MFFIFFKHLFFFIYLKGIIIPTFKQNENNFCTSNRLLRYFLLFLILWWKFYRLLISTYYKTFVLILRSQLFIYNTVASIIVMVCGPPSHILQFCFQSVCSGKCLPILVIFSSLGFFVTLLLTWLILLAAAC